MTNPHPTYAPPRQSPAAPRGRVRDWRRTALNGSALLAGLFTLYQLLGVSTYFEMRDPSLSPDDAAKKLDSMAPEVIASLFLPIDLQVAPAAAITLALFLAARSSYPRRHRPAKTGMVIAGLSFAVSFTKVSMIFPGVFAMMALPQLESGADVFGATKGDFSTSQVRIVSDVDGGVRAEGIVRNDSAHDWEKFEVEISAVRGKKPCANAYLKLDALAKGDSALVLVAWESWQTERFDCTPTKMRVAASWFDIDSRSDKTKRLHKRAPTPTAAEYTGLTLDYDGTRPRVRGTLTDASRKRIAKLTKAADQPPRLYFEVLNREGLALDRCLYTDVVGKGGKVEARALLHGMIPSHHEPLSVVPVESC